MIARIASALVRAFLVALLVVTPSLMLPAQTTNQSHLVVLLALLAAFLTFIEYAARSPSIVEFRDAPPFNRVRFVALFSTVLMLAMIVRGELQPTPLTGALVAVGGMVGDLAEFPFSPARFLGVLLPADASTGIRDMMRVAAGLASLVSLMTLAVFALLMRVPGWPGRNSAFNIWVNLPLFDPSADGDIPEKLKRDARFNIAFGSCLPFLIPVVVKVAGVLLNPVSLANPQTLVWIVTAWAFLPASMIMRGLALGRVAEMIEEKRRLARSIGPHADLQPV